MSRGMPQAGSPDGSEAGTAGTGFAGAVRRMAASLDRLDGLGVGPQVLVFLVVALLVMSRMPSEILHAQFYAEDGEVWFQQAYNQGWLHSLLIPDGGYLNTLQRVGAGLALCVPFHLAPLMGTLFSVAVQCLPVTVLLSARTRNWASLSTRALWAMIYVGCPNDQELQMVLTNCHWHLVLVVLLLGFGMPPRGWPGRVFDGFCFALSSVSGPFCLPMLVFLLAYWWVRRQGWTLAQAAITAAGGVVQVSYLLHDPNARPHKELGASFDILVRIIGRDIVAAGLLGSHLIGRWCPRPLIYVAAAAGCCFFVYLLRRTTLELRLLGLFALVLLAAALKTPLISGPLPLWGLLLANLSGRYFFFPMLACFWALVWCWRYAGRARLRQAAGATLCVLVLGVVLDWHYSPYPDFHFPASVRLYDQTKPGEVVHFEITPAAGWSVTLRKH